MKLETTVYPTSLFSFGKDAILTMSAWAHPFTKDAEYIAAFVRFDRASCNHAVQPFAVHFMPNTNLYREFGTKSMRRIDKWAECPGDVQTHEGMDFFIPRDADASWLCDPVQALDIIGHRLIVGRIIKRIGVVKKYYLNLFPPPRYGEDNEQQDYIEVELPA